MQQIKVKALFKDKTSFIYILFNVLDNLLAIFTDNNILSSYKF